VYQNRLRAMAARSTKRTSYLRSSRISHATPGYGRHLTPAKRGAPSVRSCRARTVPGLAGRRLKAAPLAMAIKTGRRAQHRPTSSPGLVSAGTSRVDALARSSSVTCLRKLQQMLAMLCHPWERASDSGGRLKRPVPRHQFVDALLRPAVDEPCQQVDKIGLRIDAIELAGLDQ
jgi:hypothetical protein